MTPPVDPLADGGAVGDRKLTEARWDSMQRIARHCAATTRLSPRPGYGLNERFDAALDALVEHVHEHGWPAPGEPDKRLFYACNTAIVKAGNEMVKHLARSAWWHEPHGEQDAIAERITDRIGVAQLTWAFTEREWIAVWAAAELQRRDEGRQSREDGAALAGLHVADYADRLRSARSKAYGLWVAPGESPFRRYRATRDGRKSKAESARLNREYRARHREAA